jgi:hypothetical protein
MNKEGQNVGFIETLNAVGITENEREIWRDENKVNQKQNRVLEVQQGAIKLKSGEISQNEYIDIVRTYQPIKPFQKVPELPTFKEIACALNKDKVAKGIIGVNYFIEDGTRVASRLDIPAYDDYNVWIVSVHSAIGEKILSYGKSANLKNIEFKSFPKIAMGIAIDKSKSTIGRIYGDWINYDPVKLRQKAIKYMDSKDWIQVGMNPYRHSWFYDKSDGMPVLTADEVIQIGALVLAKNTIKTTPDNPIFIADEKKQIRFNKGGTTKYFWYTGLFNS